MQTVILFYVSLDNYSGPFGELEEYVASNSPTVS